MTRIELTIDEVADLVLMASAIDPENLDVVAQDAGKLTGRTAQARSLIYKIKAVFEDNSEDKEGITIVVRTK